MTKREREERRQDSTHHDDGKEKGKKVGVGLCPSIPKKTMNGSQLVTSI